MPRPQQTIPPAKIHIKLTTRDFIWAVAEAERKGGRVSFIIRDVIVELIDARRLIP